MLVPILDWFLLRDNKRHWRSDLAALELKLHRKIVVGAASTCSAGVKEHIFKIMAHGGWTWRSVGISLNYIHRARGTVTTGSPERNGKTLFRPRRDSQSILRTGSLHVASMTGAICIAITLVLPATMGNLNVLIRRWHGNAHCSV